MNYIKHLTGFFDKVTLDDRLNPTHISLYVALFQYWNMQRFKNPISISRNEVMRVSKIASKATYHKCMKDLHNYNFLEYDPSFNPFRGSLVTIFDLELKHEQVQKKARNKTKIQPTPEQALNKHQTGTETSIEQALVPYVNNTNIINNTNILNKSERTQKNEDENSLNFVEVKKEKKEKEKSFAKNEKQIGKDGATPQKNNFRFPSPAGEGVLQRRTDEVKGVAASRGMLIPEISEVKEYFSSQNSPAIEAEKFFNHFQSNGWLVGGRSKMKDWHSASKNWILNGAKFQSNQMNTKRNNLNATTTKNYNEPL